jgi:hypothetical protein
MPKLGEYRWIRDIVFFLYRSVEDARSGLHAEGTGFFAALPSKRWPDKIHHAHGITNWHGACHLGASVIRLNRRDGGVGILELGPEDWHFIPASYDIPVTPPLVLDSRIHQIEALVPSFFLTASEESEHEVDAGDDVFMLGRFVDYDGIETNRPAFRFGHISMLDAIIKQRTGYMGRSIIVDMHSRTGFSGSPVFLYRTAGAIFCRPNTIMGGGHMSKLLGIHWGQFPELWEISGRKGRNEDAEQAAHVVTEGQYVKGLSGMTCVCPAERIMEVLELPSLIAMREAQEAHLAEHLG